LDGLDPVMDQVAACQLDKPAVFVIDREADSVAHYRRWDQAGKKFLIRANNSRHVLYEGTECQLHEVARDLHPAMKHTRQVLYKGKPAEQFVAQTTIVLNRPAYQHRVGGRGKNKRKRHKVIAGPAIDGGSLCAVVEWCAGSMGVDITHLRRGNTRVVARFRHGEIRGVAEWMRLREMVHIGGGAVAGDFAQDAGAPPAGVVKTFERQKPRPLAQSQAVTVDIERPALGGRKRLQGIEAGEDQLTERVVSTGQNPFGTPVANLFPRVSDGVRPRGAGVGNDGDRSLETQRRGQFESLPLGLVMHSANRLAPLRTG
jgi:hypothetical protein